MQIQQSDVIIQVLFDQRNTVLESNVTLLKFLDVRCYTINAKRITLVQRHVVRSAFLYIMISGREKLDFKP